jgi:hypothetical protein
MPTPWVCERRALREPKALKIVVLTRPTAAARIPVTARERPVENSGLGLQTSTTGQTRPKTSVMYWANLLRSNDEQLF